MVFHIKPISASICNVEILSVNRFIEWSANTFGHSGPILFLFFSG